MRKELRMGLVYLACYIILQRFMALPIVFMGIIFGLCLSFIVMGILPVKAYETVMDNKNKLKNSIINKIKGKK